MRCGVAADWNGHAVREPGNACGDALPVPGDPAPKPASDIMGRGSLTEHGP